MAAKMPRQIFFSSESLTAVSFQAVIFSLSFFIRWIAHSKNERSIANSENSKAIGVSPPTAKEESKLIVENPTDSINRNREVSNIIQRKVARANHATSFPTIIGINELII